MKLYSYESNIICASNGRNVVVLAANKKEALKFAKNYEGLKIGERVKGKSNYIPYSIDDFMNTQSNLLGNLLKNGKVRIEKWKKFTLNMVIV